MRHARLAGATICLSRKSASRPAQFRIASDCRVGKGAPVLSPPSNSNRTRWWARFALVTLLLDCFASLAMTAQSRSAVVPRKRAAHRDATRRAGTHHHRPVWREERRGKQLSRQLRPVVMGRRFRGDDAFLLDAHRALDQKRNAMRAAVRKQAASIFPAIPVFAFRRTPSCPPSRPRSSPAARSGFRCRRCSRRTTSRRWRAWRICRGGSRSATCR